MLYMSATVSAAEGHTAVYGMIGHAACWHILGRVEVSGASKSG
jgi:hypothetical protein